MSPNNQPQNRNNPKTNSKVHLGLTLATSIPLLILGIVTFLWGGYYLFGYAIIQAILSFVVSNFFRYRKWAYSLIVLLPIIIFGGLALAMWVLLARPDTGMQELFFGVFMVIFAILSVALFIYNLIVVVIQLSFLKKEKVNKTTNYQPTQKSLSKNPTEDLHLASIFTLKLLIPVFIFLLADVLILFRSGYNLEYLLLINISELLIYIFTFFAYTLLLFKYYRLVLYAYIVIPLLPILSSFLASIFSYILIFGLGIMPNLTSHDGTELVLGFMQIQDMVILSYILFPVLTFIFHSVIAWMEYKKQTSKATKVQNLREHGNLRRV